HRLGQDRSLKVRPRPCRAEDQPRSRSKWVPVTSAHVRPVIAAPVMGLVPTSPVIFELGTSLTPDFDRTAKEPAAPTLTGNRVVVVAAGRTELWPVSA